MPGSGSRQFVVCACRLRIGSPQTSPAIKKQNPFVIDHAAWAFTGVLVDDAKHSLTAQWGLGLIAQSKLHP
jgi:hypothetical protein